MVPSAHCTGCTGVGMPYQPPQPTSNVLFSVATVAMRRGNCQASASRSAPTPPRSGVNGEEVIGIYNDRQTVIDDGVSKRLTLKQGANVIRGAILNAGGASDFCARFLDPGNRPLTDITVRLTDR